PVGHHRQPAERIHGGRRRVLPRRTKRTQYPNTAYDRDRERRETNDPEIPIRSRFTPRPRPPPLQKPNQTPNKVIPQPDRDQNAPDIRSQPPRIPHHEQYARSHVRPRLVPAHLVLVKRQPLVPKRTVHRNI